MDAGFLVISHPKLTRNMEEMTVINIVIVAVLVTAVAVYLFMRRQKDAVQDEMNRLTLRLTEMELKMEAERTINNMLLASTGSSAVVAGVATMGETGSAGEPIAAGKERKAAAVDLSAMDDKELFEHISRVIRDEELFRWPDFNRAAAMEQFSLSAARIGGAFMRGGGMGMPEFVRNCRLDYACRLMVERPELSFTEVGEASGYQRTTTFYHDFKARFGMPPAEYRAQQLKQDDATAIQSEQPQGGEPKEQPQEITEPEKNNDVRKQ